VDVERVTLKGASADLRSASCLYVYNTLASPTTPLPGGVNQVPGGATQMPTNLRILNSQFLVGNCHVGVLVVNGGRVQIEGNLVLTQPVSLNVKPADLVNRAGLANRLEKLLVHQLTIVDSAAISKKARRKLVRQMAAQKKAVAGAGNKQATSSSAPASTTAPPTTVPVTTVPPTTTPAPATTTPSPTTKPEPTTTPTATAGTATPTPALTAAAAPVEVEMVKESASLAAPKEIVAKIAVVAPKVNLGQLGGLM
jgi:hypothetical protein